MNNILNKIAQMERNAAELQGVELAKYEVELKTIYDDLSGTLKEANTGFFKALDLRGQASKLCRESITKNQAILKELSRAEGLIKEIGLDSELTKVQKAKSEVERNIKLIDEALSNFLAI
jgi:hypothetical protein